MYNMYSFRSCVPHGEWFSALVFIHAVYHAVIHQGNLNSYMIVQVIQNNLAGSPGTLLFEICAHACTQIRLAIHIMQVHWHSSCYMFINAVLFILFLATFSIEYIQSYSSVSHSTGVLCI